MSCDCNSAPPITTVTSEKTITYSTGADSGQGTSAVFVMSPASLVQLATLLTKLRVTVVVYNRSEAAEVYPFIETTDDGCTWNEVTTGLVVNSSNWIDSVTTMTSSWWTSTSELLRGIRIGLKCRQATGNNDLQMATVQLLIDYEVVS